MFAEVCLWMVHFFCYRPTISPINWYLKLIVCVSVEFPPCRPNKTYMILCTVHTHTLAGKYVLFVSTRAVLSTSPHSNLSCCLISINIATCFCLGENLWNSQIGPLQNLFRALFVWSSVKWKIKNSWKYCGAHTNKRRKIPKQLRRHLLFLLPYFSL